MFYECVPVSGEGFLLGGSLALQECGSIVLHAQVDTAGAGAGAGSSSMAGGCDWWKGHQYPLGC